MRNKIVIQSFKSKIQIYNKCRKFGFLNLINWDFSHHNGPRHNFSKVVQKVNWVLRSLNACIIKYYSLDSRTRYNLTNIIYARIKKLP